VNMPAPLKYQKQHISRRKKLYLSKRLCYKQSAFMPRHLVPEE